MLAFLLSAAIVLTSRLRRHPEEFARTGIFIGLLPFLLSPFHLYMAAISWEWPGYVKGLEFSTLDALAFSIIFALPPRTNYGVPLKFSMAFYFIASALSIMQSDVPMGSVFYCWQLIRMFVVYYAVARACAVPYFASNCLTGLAIGLSYDAVTAGWEHFVLGQIQAAGTEAHQNTLGLLSHLIAFPFFALLLAGRTGWLPAAAVFAALIVEVSTTSRATVALAAAGYLGLFLVSAFRRWTSRKARVLLIGSVLAITTLPLVAYSFEQRFAREQQAGFDPEYDERAAFERAASMIFDDHPFGVGVNTYVLVANTYGYNVKAGVALTWGSLSANVHNVYKLIAAESGYPGLVSFLLLLFNGFYLAASRGWRYRRDPRGDLLLGIAVGFLVFYFHCQYEWVFVTFELQYLYAIELGLVAGISQQLARKGRRTGASS